MRLWIFAGILLLYIGYSAIPRLTEDYKRQRVIETVTAARVDSGAFGIIGSTPDDVLLLEYEQIVAERAAKEKAAKALEETIGSFGIIH